MQASNTAYGRVMTVSVSGQALDQGGLAMTVDNVCTNLTKLAGGTEFNQTFTCRVGSIGEFNMRVSDSGGGFLASLSAVVPLPQVTLNTSRGVIVVELDLPKAPISVDNFLRYVNATPSFYANTIFSRIEQGKVIQAGGYKVGFVAITAVNPPIALESQHGLKNLRGTIGMARERGTGASATSQFFFNLKDNPDFDYQSAEQPGLAVFGKIISGTEAIDVIGDVPTLSPEHPITQVVITSATQTK